MLSLKQTDRKKNVPNIKATFDAATLADAVQKASRVAPVKGAAYDKAQGLYFSAAPGAEWATVKSTNLDTSYLQHIRHTGTPPAPGYDWRIPSAMLNGLVSSFPMSQGATVAFIDTGDGAIRIVSGNTKVRLSLITGDFPLVEDYDNSSMGEAHDFAQRVSQVAWACDKASNLALSGIHIDGESLIACDSKVAAIVPCQVPVTHPVTAPLWSVTSLLKSASDVRLEAKDKELRISLDQESKMTSRLIEQPYPDVKALIRDNFTGVAKLPRSQVVDSIGRLLVVAHTERLPTMKMSFMSGFAKRLVLDLEVPEKGRIQDEVLINGDFDEDFSIWFTPTDVVNALENAKADEVDFHFGHEEREKASLKECVVKNQSGYMAMIMPRQPS